MDGRSIGLAAGGTLTVVLLLLIGQSPPVIWLLAATVAAVVVLYVAVDLAREDGRGLAHDLRERMAASTRSGTSATATPPTTVPEPMAMPDAGQDDAPARQATSGIDRMAHGSAVEVELVRAADELADRPEIWLHRSGGRRVHRSMSDGSWTVRQVSTKDPDNPRLRVIGSPLTFASEEEAVRAADDLAQGILPEDLAAARRYGVPPSATAEARRRKVKLTSKEQARRLASGWGMHASA